MRIKIKSSCNQPDRKNHEQRSKGQDQPQKLVSTEKKDICAYKSDLTLRKTRGLIEK